MKIEKIEKKDLPEMARLVREEFPNTFITEKMLENKIKKEKSFFFKAVEKSKMLGFVDFEIAEPEIAKINGLVVKEDSRGKEYGKELMKFAIEFLKKKGIKRIILIV